MKLIYTIATIAATLASPVCAQYYMPSVQDQLAAQQAQQMQQQALWAQQQQLQEMRNQTAIMQQQQMRANMQAGQARVQHSMDQMMCVSYGVSCR